MSYIDSRQRDLQTQIYILESENEILRKQIKELKEPKQMSYWTLPILKETPHVKNEAYYSTEIIDKVVDFYNLSVKQVKGKSRKKNLVKARWIAMYLIREKTNMKLTAIGKLFERDHTTVIHAIQGVNDVLNLKYETDLKEDLLKIQAIV